MQQPSVLCTYDRPESCEAEAYRKLRTSLRLLENGQPCKLIEVSSPCAGRWQINTFRQPGRLAVQSGKRVLLIDADLWHASQHQIFDVENDQGLTTLLSDNVDPSDVIRSTQIAGLSLLPAGPTSTHPADLLASNRLPELLALVREQYDYVLVDSPPLLAVTGAQIIAPHADSVLLNIRLTKNGRPAACQAREILLGLGAKQVAVVVVANKPSRNGDALYYRSIASAANQNGRHDGNGKAKRDEPLAAVSGTR